MSKQTTTYTTPGSNAYTAPATLLNGSVAVTVDGSPGAAASGVNGGKGARVVGTCPIAASGTATAVVGDTGTNGQHAGGAGNAGTGGGTAGAHGGGSSGFTVGATLLIEAGGGGGAGGAKSSASGGAGGKGGLSAGNGGTGGSVSNAGSGDGGAGGGGGGNQGVGQAAPSSTISNGSPAPGGTAPGGAGVQEAAGANFFGGGGGAGGKSFAGGTVSGVTYSDGLVSAAQVQVVATVADAPLAPTLTAPANGASIDINAVGATFTWTYNPGTDSGSQSAYALRVSQDGGAYQYWNATSQAFQGTIVWNTQSSTSVVVPAAKLADGHTYTWSIATQENHYSLQGPFASDNTFTGTAQPTATITAPAGTVSVASPTVVWTEVLGGGDVQTAFRVVIYTQAVTGQPGFSPGVTTPTVDSGVVSSAAVSWAVPGASALAQGNWVAYVQITETGSLVSAWASSSFTVAYDPPAKPLLSATPGIDPPTGIPTITLVVTGQDNIVSADDASFENSVGTWVAGANTTIVQSPTFADDGSDSLKLTATALGSVTANTATGISAYPVVGSTNYAATAAFRAGSTGRTFTLGINWYTAAGALISTSTGTGVADVTTGWTVATVAATAPSNAAFAGLVVTGASLAASEVHYLDEVGLFNETTAPAWTRGGLVGSQVIVLQRSIDGGNTWTSVRGPYPAVPTTTQQITVVDWEAPFGVNLVYQAFVTAAVTTPTPGTITSPAATSSTVQTSVPGTWMLTDPLDTTISLPFSRLGTSGSTNEALNGSSAADTSVRVPISVEFDTSETMGIFEGWNNPNPIIQRGTIYKPTFTVAGYITGYTAYATWQSLTGRDGKAVPRQHTLLMRDDMGRAWYVVVGPSLADQLLRAPDRTVNPQWIITIPCIVTAAP